MTRKRKRITYPPEPLTPLEAKRLVLACNPRYPTGARNRALIALLYRSGLRCAEALDLRTYDLDAKGGTVRVVCGKGGKARTVGMDAMAFDLVDDWLRVRQSRSIHGFKLFCTLKGGTLATSYVRAMVKRMARRAGIERRVHPHGLRHTLASELRAEGVDVGVISKQLGHASIATTARYLDHINPAMVVEAMQARSW